RGTGAWHQRDEPYPLRQAHPQRAFTVGFTLGHNAAHPIESQCQACFNGYGRLRTVAGIAIAHAEAEWETLTAHAEAQEHLLEIIMAIFAVPIRRPRWDWPLPPVGRLLIRPIESDRRGILMEPGGREGIDLQGMERNRPKHPVQRRRKQRLEDLPQPVIMERGARQARLEYR